VSSRSWKERLEDILTCARNIKEFTAGRSLDDFLDDPITVRAVAYEFITMGEAARTVPPDVQEQYPDLPWGKMLGIRNVLVHEYFRLDEEILWKAAMEDIPPLIEVLEKISD
jgi:uncharacterized protein with HEPN domain